MSILFRRSFTSGLIPLDWKNAFVRPVYKKGDKFDPGNYRPFFIEHRRIPLQQHGFIPGKSIITNLLCCLSDWTKQFDMGQSLDLVYLDFSKLDHCGIKGGLLKWIEGFLSDRTFQVKIGNSTSSPVSVLSRVPQGSVLGPLLFSVYTSDI